MGRSKTFTKDEEKCKLKDKIKSMEGRQGETQSNGANFVNEKDLGKLASQQRTVVPAEKVLILPKIGETFNMRCGQLNLPQRSNSSLNDDRQSKLVK